MKLQCPKCNSDLYARQIQTTTHDIDIDEDGYRSIYFDKDRDYECQVSIHCHGCDEEFDADELDIGDW